jgi:periplasmic protein CpxP/Spy
MNAKKTATLFAALLLPLALAGACGGPRHHGGEVDLARVDRRVTDHLDDYLDDAKATPDQRTKILAIKSRLLPEGGALAQSHRKAQQELAAQLASDKPDGARLHALVDQQLEAVRAFAHKSVDGALEAHGTLSREQRAPVTKKLQRYAQR